MTRRLRWLVPACCLFAGLYGLFRALRAYAKWQEFLALKDISGAEAFEMEFWPEISLSLFLVLLGAFLAGRWSVR